MSVLLSVRDLKQHFKMGGGFLRKPYTVYAVDGISFDLKQGETLGLVGESGCGKSTLGRSLLKLFEPTAGQISFEGRDITRLSPGEMRSLRQEMQIVFQDPAESLNGRHTVGQILEEPFIIHGKGNTAQRRGWVLELLDKVGLPKSAVDRYPHEFSGGQRQRIGIARAIALKPRLLVCDEAVSALDVSVQSQIVNLLLTLQREMNLAIIFIAHDLSDSGDVPRAHRRVGRGPATLSEPAPSLHPGADLGDPGAGSSQAQPAYPADRGCALTHLSPEWLSFPSALPLCHGSVPRYLAESRAVWHRGPSGSLPLPLACRGGGAVGKGGLMPASASPGPVSQQGGVGDEQ